MPPVRRRNIGRRSATQDKFLIVQSMRLLKSVGSVWRQSDYEFPKHDLPWLWENTYINKRTSETLCFSEALIVTCYPCSCVNESDSNWICERAKEKWTEETLGDKSEQPCECSSDGVIKTKCTCAETICCCQEKIEVTCKCDKSCFCFLESEPALECVCSEDSVPCACYGNEMKPKCVCGKADICLCSIDGSISPECVCHKDDQDDEPREKICRCSSDGAIRPICVCDQPESCLCEFSISKIIAPVCTCSQQIGCACNAGPLLPTCKCEDSEACLCRTKDVADSICICDNPDTCLCLVDEGKISSICKCGQSPCVCHVGEEHDDCPCESHPPICERKSGAICRCRKYPCRSKLKEKLYETNNNSKVDTTLKEENSKGSKCKCKRTPCRCHGGKELNKCPCEKFPPICNKDKSSICLCAPTHGKYPCGRKIENPRVTANEAEKILSLNITDKEISSGDACKCLYHSTPQKQPCQCHEGHEYQQCSCKEFPPFCEKMLHAICVCPPKDGKYQCGRKIETDKVMAEDEIVSENISEKDNSMGDTCKCLHKSTSLEQPCRCHEDHEYQECPCKEFPPFCEKKRHAICTCPPKNGKYPCGRKMETNKKTVAENEMMSSKKTDKEKNAEDTCECSPFIDSLKQPCRCHEGREYQECPCEEFPPFCEKKIQAICVCPPQKGKYPCGKSRDPQEPYYSFAYGSRGNIEPVIKDNKQPLKESKVNIGKESKLCKCDQGPCLCHEGNELDACPCEEFPPICDQETPTICLCPPEDGKYPCNIETEADKVYEPCRDCSCTTGGTCISIESVGDRQDRFMVQINSDFSKEGTVKSTKLVSIVDDKLHTIEEIRTERSITGNILRERRNHMTLSDSGYNNKVTVFCGDKASSITIFHHADRSRDFLLEGANMILLRYLALTKFRGEFETKTVLMDGTVCQNKYICYGVTKRMVNDQRMSVMKVVRQILEESGSMHESHSVFTLKGYLVSHEWMDCGYSLRLNPLVKVYPETDDIELIPPLRCRWREHAQLLSDYLDFKAARIEDAELYTAEHPELRNMVADYLQVILHLQPSDVLHFTQRFFASQLGDLGLDLPYNDYFELDEPYYDIEEADDSFQQYKCL